MTTPNKISPQELYCQLMEEIKDRLRVFRRFCIEDPNPKHGVSHAHAHEFCYLQLRFICELIALASLIAHGDIAATKSAKLRKSYKPGVILSEMAKLHSDFYPKALKQKLDSNGRLIGWTGAPDFLSKSNLAALWSECGANLHRGSIKDIEAYKTPDFWRPTQWHNKRRPFEHSHDPSDRQEKCVPCALVGRRK